MDSIAAAETEEAIGGWAVVDEVTFAGTGSCVAVGDGKSEADGEDALLAGFASSTGWEPCRVRLP